LLRPVILINTEKNSDAKNRLLEKYNYIDCYYFFHAFAAADWFRGYQYCHDLTLPQNRKIKKKFITFNRLTGNARCYRSFLIAELEANNLINLGNISYSHICPEYGHYSKNLYHANIAYDINKNYIQQSIQLLDSIDHPLRIDSTKESFIANGSQTLNAIPKMMESFLHIVTETCYWEQKLHLTEKIFKPIVARQPFVLLGCTFNLQYLKSYGFQTFDKWWDESYDCIVDPILRLKAVIKIIKQLCEYSDQELQNLLNEMTPVLDHNYNLFYSRNFIDNCWQELCINLQDAIAQLPPLNDVKIPDHLDYDNLHHKLLV